MALDRIGGAVVGGGVVGCAVLHELALAGVEDLFLFERLPHLGDAQSGRNSGVVHALRVATIRVEDFHRCSGPIVRIDVSRPIRIPCISRFTAGAQTERPIFNNHRADSIRCGPGHTVVVGHVELTEVSVVVAQV